MLCFGATLGCFRAYSYLCTLGSLLEAWGAIRGAGDRTRIRDIHDKCSAHCTISPAPFWAWFWGHTQGWGLLPVVLGNHEVQGIRPQSPTWQVMPSSPLSRVLNHTWQVSVITLNKSVALSTWMMLSNNPKGNHCPHFLLPTSPSSCHPFPLPTW